MLLAVGALLASLTPVEYAELVDTYRGGSFEQAVRALSEADPADVRDISREFKPSTDAQRMAAVMLHSEAAMRNVEQELIHLEAAEKYLEGIENQTFLRRWRLLMAQHYLRLMRPWNAVPHLDAARELFPRDRNIYLQSGVAYELAGWLGSKRMLENARLMFRTVIEAEQDHAEAHLRLGRVHELLGDSDGAVAEIRRSLSLSNEPSIAVPANLLLGDLVESKGDLDRAIRYYSAAVRADPFCQPAVVALSHALYRKRDYARSREVIEAFLGSGPRESDHWWSYVQGDPHAIERALSELRDEVRR